MANNETTPFIVGALVLGLLALWLYFLPTQIAFNRNHHYRWIIFAINLVFGASGLGWLIALVWAIYPSDRSLADPVLVNTSGLGTRSQETYADWRSRDSGSAASPAAPSAIEAIERLATLLERKAITQQEFDEKKSQLLSKV